MVQWIYIVWWPVGLDGLARPVFKFDRRAEGSIFWQISFYMSQQNTRVKTQNMQSDEIE